MGDHSQLIVRATPPEILFAGDMAALLGILPPEAELQARTGRLGPAFFVNGRIAVLREDLMNVLRLRASAPECEDREVLT